MFSMWGIAGDQSYDRWNEIVLKEQEEVHGKSVGNNEGIQASGVSFGWFVIGSCSASPSNSA